MTYQRVINRNWLQGNYNEPGMVSEQYRSLICGDLRRLEKDQRDEFHLQRYAEMACVTKDQVKRILDALFEGIE